MLKFPILAQILSKYTRTFIVSTNPVLVLLMVCLIDRTGRVRSSMVDSLCKGGE